MNRIAALIVLALAVGGCESGHGGLKNTPAPQADGKVGGYPINGNTVAYVPAGTTIAGQDTVVFSIKDPKNAARNFWVMLGSAMRPDGTTVSGAGGPGTIDGCFNLLTGSAYLIGALPWLTSEIVDIASDGTTILVEVYPATSSEPLHARVMLVNNPTNGNVHIKNNKTGDQATLSVAGKYVDVTAPSAAGAGGIGVATPFDPATATHVADVKQKAITAGIPPEP